MRSASASTARRCVMITVVRLRVKVSKHLLDGLLAFQVDLAGGLVEDQDGRVAEDGPGQGDPLPLAAGEPAAERADHRVVALRQVRLDEVVGVGLLGRLDHLARGWPAAGRSGCCCTPCRRTAAAPA